MKGCQDFRKFENHHSRATPEDLDHPSFPVITCLPESALLPRETTWWETAQEPWLYPLPLKAKKEDWSQAEEELLQSCTLMHLQYEKIS